MREGRQRHAVDTAADSDCQAVVARDRRREPILRAARYVAHVAFSCAARFAEDQCFYRKNGLFAILLFVNKLFDVIEQDAAAWAARVRQEAGAQPVVLQPGQWMDA